MSGKEDLQFDTSHQYVLKPCPREPNELPTGRGRRVHWKIQGVLRHLRPKMIFVYNKEVYLNYGIVGTYLVSNANLFLPCYGSPYTKIIYQFWFLEWYDPFHLMYYS